MDASDDALLLEAKQLLQRAQVGHAAKVLQTAEARLRELRDGAVEGGPAAMHFPRVVALIDSDDVAALAAAEDMLQAAERKNALGWRACALAIRGGLKLLLGEDDPAHYDVESVLVDLAAAEAALELSTDVGYVASTAHVAIANGYVPLPLYELARSGGRLRNQSRSIRTRGRGSESAVQQRAADVSRARRGVGLRPRPRRPPQPAGPIR